MRAGRGADVGDRGERDVVERDSVDGDAVHRDSVAGDVANGDFVDRDSAHNLFDGDFLDRDSVDRDSVARHSAARDSVARHFIDCDSVECNPVDRHSVDRNSAARDFGERDFVARDSVVRTIWGNGDMVLLVFAGSAAEFALNRAVDWLFFTGKLPRDPIGRLFSTAGYAQQIVFADVATASAALGRIRAAHEAVERQRGQQIPHWAHRDVLYMLIDYSERAHEMLARPLTEDVQQELYAVFHRVGTGLHIPDLPSTYADWKIDRELHLRRDLVYGHGTAALYAQYRNHLGRWRYALLLRLQSILCPEHARSLLRLHRAEWLRPLIRVYPRLVRAGLRSVIQRLLMPKRHLDAVRALDHAGR